MEFNVKSKVDGRWQTVGSIRQNQWGNYSLGLKIEDVVPLIEQAKAEGKGWLNLSLMEPLTKDAPAAPAPRREPPAQSMYDDEIPF